MISHVYLSAVLMLAALPVVWCQCTTSRCQDSKYEPPRWENGAVYLESLLTETSERILGAVESRLADQTATMASRLADQTATMESRLAKESVTIENRLTEAVDARLATLKADLENSTTGHLEAQESRLAQHTEAVDDRLATLKTELENTTTNRLAALEERMVVENRNFATNSESRLNLTIGAMMNSMERRLADQTGSMESRLAGLTGSIESRLADHAEYLHVGLATLKTELGNTTTDRLEALEERMVVESRNATTNSESRLNLTIGAMMNNIESRLAEQSATIERRLADQTTTIASRLAQHTEAVDERLATLKIELENTTTDRLEALKERMVVENRNLANNSESRLKFTISAMMNNMETSLTALSSYRGSDQMMAAVYNMSNTQLQILRLLESQGQVTFLRRVDGSVNFTRDWADYKGGFGDVNGEFWLDLDKLHQLTTQHEYGLRVDMEDFSGERKWAVYQSFRVGSESSNYVLTISGYNSDSTAGDSMTYQNGMKFSTYDRDNDPYSSNCAASQKGGWWYKDCAYSKPTGLYKPAGYRGSEGIKWYHAYGDWRSFKSFSLKLVGN